MPSVKAPVIARLFIDEIISRHGAPRVLLSDRGTNFLSKVVAEVCKIFQIQKVNTSSYHPQTDGTVERFKFYLVSVFVNVRFQKPERLGPVHNSCFVCA